MKLRPLHGEENRSLTEQLDVFLTSKTCFCADDDDDSSVTDHVTSRWAGTFKSLTHKWPGTHKFPPTDSHTKNPQTAHICICSVRFPVTRLTSLHFYIFLAASARCTALFLFFCFLFCCFHVLMFLVLRCAFLMCLFLKYVNI